MDSIFKEAEEFNRSYDILLTKFLNSNFKILTEDTNENAVDSLSTAFKNFKTFTHKIKIWRKEFNLKMKVNKASLKSKKNVDFILKTLYHLPPNTKITFPDFMAIVTDARNFYKQVYTLADKIFEYDVIDWVKTPKVVKTIYKIDDLCNQYHKLMIDNINRKKQITVREAITIISEMFYDTKSYYDFNGEQVAIFYRIAGHINAMAPKIEDFMRKYASDKDDENGEENLRKLIETIKKFAEMMESEYLFSDEMSIKMNDYIQSVYHLLNIKFFSNKPIEDMPGELKNWNKYIDKINLLDAKHRTGELNNGATELLAQYAYLKNSDTYKKSLEKK